MFVVFNTSSTTIYDSCRLSPAFGKHEDHPFGEGGRGSSCHKRVGSDHRMLRSNYFLLLDLAVYQQFGCFSVFRLVNSVSGYVKTGLGHTSFTSPKFLNRCASDLPYIRETCWTIFCVIRFSLFCAFGAYSAVAG